MNIPDILKKFATPVRKRRAGELRPGENIHIGYVPIDEEEAFQRPTPFYLLNRTLRIPRASITLDELIMLIRGFVESNHVNTIIPRDIIGLARYVYHSDHLATEGDNYAKIAVLICADMDTQEYIVEVSRTQGDSAIFSRFYQTIHLYLSTLGSEGANIVEHCGRYNPLMS
jgi:hypothetical protein